MSLASPQNPSGVRFTEDELRALLATVHDRAPNAVVLVDETYRESTYGERPSAAVGRDDVAADRDLLLAFKGARRAGAAARLVDHDRRRLYGQLREAKFLATIACSTVDEFLAAQVLRRRTEILASRAQRLRQALDELLRWTRDQPVEIVVPDGGAMCCLRLPAERFSDDAVTTFYARLTERDTRVAPGSWFGEHDRVFRLGFGHLSASDFSTALDHLTDALPGSS